MSHLLTLDAAKAGLTEARHEARAAAWVATAAARLAKAREPVKVREALTKQLEKSDKPWAHAALRRWRALTACSCEHSCPAPVALRVVRELERSHTSSHLRAVSHALSIGDMKAAREAAEHAPSELAAYLRDLLGRTR